MSKKVTLMTLSLCICSFLVIGCQDQETARRDIEKNKWLEIADLDAKETTEELYEKALKEDTLVVYSVTTRAFDVKESFEKEYPEITVEIKDIRSKDVIDMVKKSYDEESFLCDVVICSNCNGTVYKDLVEPGICYTYVPWDMKDVISEKNREPLLNFIGEAILPFYNTSIYEESPINNIWELTEEQYYKKIIMANPLRSFSTYAFCATLLKQSEEIENAYMEYTGKPLKIAAGETAGEVFWKKFAPQVVFVNSSDDVVEGVGNDSGMHIGFMISSKMRFLDIGYEFAPIYQLCPFAGVYTPNSVAIVEGSKSINSAKLFIRYLLGGADGTGEGGKPFISAGTWSTRTDVEDGNDRSIDEIEMIDFDAAYIYENKEEIDTFFESMLMESIEN